MKPEDRIAEIDGFMHFALGEWPALRSSVVNELARRCEKCILSEKASPIREGVCEACRGSSAGGQPRRAEPDFDALRASLDELLREQGGRGSRAHDALVLYSGGKDSTLLVHKLTTEYPRLRILCLMVDNGFASPVALANTRRVFERIDADHFVYKPRASLFRKTFRHAFTHLGRGGCYGTVDRLDGELTFDIGRNLAASLQIPLLIIGLSGEQCERILGLSNFESPREWEREKRTVEEFGLQDLYSEEERRHWWNAAAWPEDRRPRVLYPYYAWQLPEQLIQSEVVRLGLIEQGQDNPLATNSDLIPLMLAVDVIRQGYSGFEPEFAQMIREGKSDRQVWLNIFESLEYLARQGKFLPGCVDDVLERLGLTRAEVGLAISASIR